VNNEMNTTASKVEEILERRLRDANLSRFVKKEHSQFLDLQDEVFVEVVLIDGAALDAVERIVRQTAEELRPQGITLDSVVRALWEIVEVTYVGPSRAPSGGIRAASEFRAILRSGSRDCRVIVNVSWSATELLERKLGLKEVVAKDNGALRQEMVTRMVTGFLQHQLSGGGTSYWNPLLDQPLELNEAAMSFLLGQSTAFEELRNAISDAFEPSVLDSFVNGLSISGIRIGDFSRVLPELSNMLGGAYRRGGTFSTSTSELFQKLDRTEQELLKKYFHGKVELLKADSQFPELAQKFPNVFS
jgi:hypothetical protein